MYGATSWTLESKFDGTYTHMLRAILLTRKIDLKDEPELEVLTGKRHLLNKNDCKFRTRLLFTEVPFILLEKKKKYLNINIYSK